MQKKERLFAMVFHVKKVLMYKAVCGLGGNYFLYKGGKMAMDRKSNKQNTYIIFNTAKNGGFYVI